MQAYAMSPRNATWRYYLEKYQFTLKTEHIMYMFHHSHDRVIQMMKSLGNFDWEENSEIYNSKISKFLWP